MNRFDKFYMKTAISLAEQSYAKKLKVGCIITKDNTIISMGYNGTPPGTDNICEDILEDGTLKTKPQVIHAEINALGKLAASTVSSDDSIMYITTAPCSNCVSMIVASRVKKIFFMDYYRDMTGIEILKSIGIEVIQIKKEEL